ncbi:chondroitin AC/alginate lyase [Bisporella sp. PMI_857]|nr:chondroitin AC/alginate lyase [Bisporella sp. PMI_857]
MASVTLIQLFFLLPLVSAFIHPGLLVNDVDIVRIKSKLAAKLDPWQSSWEKLTTIKYGQAGYTNNAVSGVYRDTVDGVVANAQLLWHDAAAAFNLGLRWKIEGDEQFAEAAAKILIAWGETLQDFDVGDDKYLTVGLQGHQLANAAELIRDYEPFASGGMATFIDMFRNVILEKNIFFLNHQAPSEHNHKHFHANWELCNIASVMAFGVLTDNSTLFDYAVNYFKNGSGNGAINNAITNLVEEPGTGTILGQPQEAGRDQGHSALDFQLFGVIGQQAWNQGEDLYAYNNSRILQGTEYFSRYNLGNDVPFMPWTNGIVSFSVISEASRGAFRPTFELLYAHYAQIKGVEAPWTERYRNYTTEAMGGFEGGGGSWGEGSGHYDGLGWGSLLYHLDDEDVVALKGTQSTISTGLLPTRTSTSATGTSVTTPSSSLSEGAVSAAPVSASLSSLSDVSIPLVPERPYGASEVKTSSVNTAAYSDIIIKLPAVTTAPVTVASAALPSITPSASATWIMSPIFEDIITVTHTVYTC